MIVKVQREIAHGEGLENLNSSISLLGNTDPNNLALGEKPGRRRILIYNKDRSVRVELPLNDHVEKRLKGRYKAFFHAHLSGGIIVLDEDAEDQKW